MKNRNKRGFTLVELMVVAIIVAILAAVAIPLMRGNTERAAATEGQAGISAIRTACRAYLAEHGEYPNGIAVTALPGLQQKDLNGTYFNDGSYVYAAAGGQLTVTATGANGPAAGNTVVLTENADGTTTWSGTLMPTP